jgi:hypothetical protein
MDGPPPDLKLPIGEVAALLGVPGQTINWWRNSGLFTDLGESRGEKKSRLYRFSEAVVLAVMRDLTSPPANLGAELAAYVALRSVAAFLGEAGYAGPVGVGPDGLFYAVKAGAGVASHEAVASRDVAGYVAEWRRENRHSKLTRLEFVDIRQIALRVSAKIVRHLGPDLSEKKTEEEVMDCLDPAFDSWLAAYAKEEISRFEQSRIENAERERQLGTAHRSDIVALADEVYRQRASEATADERRGEGSGLAANPSPHRVVTSPTGRAA